MLKIRTNIIFVSLFRKSYKKRRSEDRLFEFIAFSPRPSNGQRAPTAAGMSPAAPQ